MVALGARLDCGHYCGLRWRGCVRSLSCMDDSVDGWIDLYTRCPSESRIDMHPATPNSQHGSIAGLALGRHAVTVSCQTPRRPRPAGVGTASKNSIRRGDLIESNRIDSGLTRKSIRFRIELLCGVWSIGESERWTKGELASHLTLLDEGTQSIDALIPNSTTQGKG